MVSDPRPAAILERIAAGISDVIRPACRAGRSGMDWLRGLRRTEPLPSRPVVAVAVCLAMGCAAVRGLSGVSGASLAVACWVAAALAVVAWLAAVRSGHHRRAEWSVGAAICLAGAAWSAAQFDLFRATDLAWRLGDSPAPVAVMGTVEESFRLLPVPTEDPRRTAAIGPSSECVVRIDAFRSGSRWVPASGRAAVVVDGEPPPLALGDRIRVLGRGLRPAAAGNPGEFDFRLRGRSNRCLSIVRVSSARFIRLVSPPGRLALAASIDGLRRRGVAVLDGYVSRERAPLAAALLLGSRESLPREEADDFLATGTVHILSISGLHVGLLAAALFMILRAASVPRSWSLAAIALVTGGYMLLVRAETPVLRATLLVWLSCLAAACARRSPAINALAIAAVVVLIWRPAEVFSVGAQLSFLSTAVLVGVAAMLPRSSAPVDPIDRLIDRSRSPVERMLRSVGWQSWTLFLAGAAVWTVTAPLVTSRFHVISPVGLVVNVLVAPLVALAMGWGFLCLLVAPVSSTLATLAGAACDATLAGISLIVRLAADFPCGHAWTPGPSAWWVAGWYLLLAATLLWLPAVRLRRMQTWAVVGGAWVFVGIVVAGAGRLATDARPGVRMVMAAMGHGCGIVIRSAEDRCLVFDAGRLGAPGAARRAMAGVLWSEGISRIDTLVISHADTDHFNAVPELLERFAVGEVVVPPAFLATAAPAVTDLLARLRERGIPVRTVAAGDSFALDRSCRARVLHPAAVPAKTSVSDNETSIVLAIESAGRRLLLTGDIEGGALERLVAADPDACDVLVAPHHGSRTNLRADVAAATTPALVLVSGLGGKAWAEVRDAYAAASGPAMAAVLKTGGEGAMALDCDAETIAITRFSAGAWRRVVPGGHTTSGSGAMPPGGRQVASAPGLRR
ncbi:MAG: ComEC/Rec2 family competence protein [Planctomycetia bacterium]|nr:ComEC/Rec2 family competence protein [Planctomycetia bacterium]